MDHDTLVELFFTLTGVAVIIITILLAILFVYIISIMRTVRRVAKTVEFATSELKQDLDELRRALKEKGFSLYAFYDFFKNIAGRRVSSKRTKK